MKNITPEEADLAKSAESVVRRSNALSALGSGARTPKWIMAVVVASIAVAAFCFSGSDLPMMAQALLIAACASSFSALALIFHHQRTLSALIDLTSSSKDRA